MLYLDMPVAIYAVAMTNTTHSKTNVVRTDGICTFHWSSTKDDHRPMAMLMGYSALTIDLLPKDFVDGAWSGENNRWYREWSHSLDVEIIRPPKHGVMVIQDDLDIYPSYLPTEGYIGKDQVDVLVKAKDLEGRPIAKKLVYFINVISKKESDTIDANSLFQKYCGNQRQWRISENTQIPSDSSGQSANLLAGLLAKSSYSITYNANAVRDGKYIDYVP
jgi:hypothetical protein